MRLLRRNLTYANVIATLALFLALSGGVVWAAQKIGAKQLKANSVTTGKIKKRAVTTGKLRDRAVTNAKLGESSVNFAKIAAGTNVIATGSGGPISVSTATFENPVSIPLTGTTSFIPAVGITDLVNIEVKGINLATADPKKRCFAFVEPMVNGQLFEFATGFLGVNSASSEDKPPSPVPLDIGSGPIGLGQPGVSQQLSMRVSTNGECTPTSQVAVNFTVTQFK